MKLHTIIAQLRNFNEPVPKPARLPTEAEVANTEQRLNFQFSKDYRYFLLHASDVAYGSIEPAMITPESGHLNLVDVACTAWENGVPKELLPFCETNGDYYCIKPDGLVVYWSHGRETEDSWTDLSQWIQQVWLGEENA